MTECTPGPWSVFVGYKLIRIEQERSQFGIAHVIRNVDGRAEYDCLALANARLIAASPQMLEACELALIGFEKIGGYGPPEFANPFSEVMARLRAAIAAAKGEQQ